MGMSIGLKQMSLVAWDHRSLRIDQCFLFGRLLLSRLSHKQITEEFGIPNSCYHFGERFV